MLMLSRPQLFPDRHRVVVMWSKPQMRQFRLWVALTDVCLINIEVKCTDGHVEVPGYCW
jgi:hypothetical protein